MTDRAELAEGNELPTMMGVPGRTAQAPPVDAAKAEPQRAGDYQLLDKISDGGQAVVYRARDSRSGKVVAVKLFKVNDHDPQAEARNRSEAEILLRLKHPNIVNELGTLEFDDEWGARRTGLVMEYLEGTTLKQWVARHPRGTSWEHARPILEQCLDGLEFAQASQGVVHRDIKPSNIILLADGTVKLIDFGVAHGHASETPTGDGLLGSFDYMAPEFAEPDPGFQGDAVSDIFGLFACFYELVTGRLPFPKFGERPDLEFLARWKGPPPSLSFANINFRIVADLSKFMARGLARDRRQRFQSYAEVRQALLGLAKRRIGHEKERYDLLEGLGAGAFGEVFKGMRVSDGALVAIKRLFPDRSGEKFIKEARILAKTVHPGVVRYLDFFETASGAGASSFFLVMEFLDGMPGSSLKERIHDNPAGLPLAEVVPTFLQYASALGHLHYKGIIHRDIKPANLYAREDHPEKACILDLGVARDLSGTKTTGSVPGSWDYMAPELLTEETRGSPRSDLYALGVSLYEAITGNPAYPRLPTDDRQAYPELIARAQGTSAHSISFTDSVFEIYPELTALITRICARRPEDRPRDAREFFDDLLAFGVARLGLQTESWAGREPPVLAQSRDTSPSSRTLPAAVQAPAPAPAAPSPGRRSALAFVFVLAAFVATAGGAGWWFTRQVEQNRPQTGGGTDRPDPPVERAAVAPAPEPPPVPAASPPAEPPPAVPDATPAPAIVVVEAPPAPPQNPEALELARQIEILYRLYPVSLDYPSFSRDIFQRARSLENLLRSARDDTVRAHEAVRAQQRVFWEKMASYALAEAVAQKDPQYHAVVREAVHQGLRLEPPEDRDDVERARILFDGWQKAEGRSPPLAWPIAPPLLAEWEHADSPYRTFLFGQAETGSWRSRLLPSRMHVRLASAGGPGVPPRSVTLAFALVPDAPFPEGETYLPLSSPLYMAQIETPMEALRIHRDDAGSLPEEFRGVASGNIAAVKTQGDARAPYAVATVDEAVQFCNWLSVRAGLRPVYQRSGAEWVADLGAIGFRLPTVSEWVMAARLGLDFLAPPGQKSWADLQSDLTREGPSAAAPGTVGPEGLVHFFYKDTPRSSDQSPAYPLGLHDLAGNVAEICMVDPPPGSGSRRFTPTFVTRGGTAASKAAIAIMPEFRSGRVDDPAGLIGFRIVLPLPFLRLESATTTPGSRP